MILSWAGAAELPQVPFGRLFRRLDRPVPEGAEIVTAYTDGQVTLRTNRAKIGYHEAADLSGFKGVETGDFVVHGLDILRGSVGIADSSGAITAVCTVCSPLVELDPRYVAHVIRVQAKSGFVRALARGIREGGADFRRWGTLAELPIPMPPLGYQRAVCDYLDRETARIDTLIEEQQRLIVMLRERRQAVIDHEISPRSGAPLVALRGLVAAPISAGADETSDPANPAWWPRFIRTTDIASLTELAPEKRVTANPESTADSMLARNDLVATRAGATIGKTYIHLSDDAASYAGYLVRIRPNPAKVVPMYLAYWSQSRHYLDQVAVGAVKSTIENYSASKYRATRVPVPPLEEQRRIAAYLDAQTGKIDETIAQTQRFIELSKERRSALITAAVTRQLDMRSWRDG